VRALHAFGLAQIAFDLACLTLLAAWTGGLRSPLLGFYVFHMVFASLLLTTPWAYAAAVAAIVLLGAALWTSGQWPADRSGVLLAIGWVSTLMVTVYLTGRITRALFRREISRLRHFRRLRTMSAHLRAQERAMVQHEKMVAMGQMAAGVAHEINNPLAGMDSLLQLMERHPERPRADAVGQLRAQIERIQRIVGQLTAFAHPERGHPEAGDVNEVIRATLRLPGFEARVRRVTLSLDLQEPSVPARMIARGLQQALMNLIINALDALAGQPDPRLEIRSRRNGDSAVIDVTDNGPGIPAEHLSRIFEPFFTTKPVGQGTGLGLSISHGLIVEQGGTLEVTSPGASNSGARFTIRLASPAPMPSTPREQPVAM
jgi:C4-dicarboxylate-specific signal transduction histidine kinase